MNSPEMRSYKNDIQNRIQGMKECHIPDFGQPIINGLFDEPKPVLSNWYYIYDAICLYPKFQKLKDYIDKA